MQQTPVCRCCHRFAKLSGEEVANHMAAIERRHGDQVENTEKTLISTAAYKSRQIGTMIPASDGTAAATSPIEAPLAKAGTKMCPRGETRAITIKPSTAKAAVRKLLTGPATACEYVVAHRVLEIAVIDRRWFRPADKAGNGRSWDQRHQDRSDGIDVFDGIQGDATEHSAPWGRPVGWPSRRAPTRAR